SFLSWAATFAAVAVGFILFRANGVAQAWTMLTTLVTPSSYWHFAMPRSFYLLTLIVAVGHFVVIGAHSLLHSWSARTKDVMRERGESVPFTWRPARVVELRW